MAGKLTCVNIEVTQAGSVVTPPVNGPDLAWRTDDADGGNVVGFQYRKMSNGMVVFKVTRACSGKVPVGYRANVAAGAHIAASCGVDALQNQQWVKVDNVGNVTSSIPNSGSGFHQFDALYFPEA